MTAEKKPNNTKSSAKSKTSNNKKSKKLSKGNFGYFKSEKKRRLIITAILFAVPLFIFFTSWIYFKTRMTVWTVVAVVGCLPACKSLVEMFMFLRYKGCNEQDAAQIAAHTDGLTGLYDMVFTSYEKNYVIHHMTICGNTLCGYTSDPKFAEQAFYKHIQDILKKDNYREVTVKIFHDLDKYLKRCEQLKDLPTQPELTGGICQTLKSVSL